MTKVFFNAEGRLRNGWWALLFLAFLGLGLATFRASIPLFKHAGIGSGDWVLAVLFGLSLLATWACTHLRKEPLASVGFQLNRRWAKELAYGILLGAGVMLLGALFVALFGGVTWELHPARSLRLAATGFAVFSLVALWEENLFRGFLFQRLVEGLGIWPTQLLLAVFFALSHWGNPGMNGATKAWASLGIGLAAIFLGLAYLRTRSLALPVGIHLGWNWTQGDLLGFGVSGSVDRPGLLRPLFHGKPEWLSGGTFGLEASALGVLAIVIGIAMLWRWRGIAPEAPQPH